MSAFLPLSDTAAPWVAVRFRRNGTEHRFCSAVNTLTGNRLSWFDDSAPRIGDSLKWVRSVIRDIRARETVLEIAGTIAQ